MDDAKGIEGRAGTEHRRSELSRASGPVENNTDDQTGQRAGTRLYGDSCEVPGDSVTKVTLHETLGSSKETIGALGMTTLVGKEEDPLP